MSSSSRRILVDDTDSSIRYSGTGWFADTSNRGGTTNFFGPPYLQSLHGTKSNDSLLFSFTGTSISVYGTEALVQIPVINGTGKGTTWDPKWECFIDGVSIGHSDLLAQFESTNWELCGKDQINDGPHELTINVTTMGGTFWLDQLQFTPSPGASYGNGTNVVQVPVSDPGIKYGSGWETWLPNSVDYTHVTGAQVSFNFTGTSLTWIGYFDPKLPDPPADAQYSIDGGPPNSFVLKGLPPQSALPLWNQPFFTTPTLSPSEHSLVVTYLGNGSVAALMLQHMYVTNVSIPSGSTGAGLNPGSTSGAGSGSGSGSSAHAPSPPSHRGAIIGGVLGGILGLAVLIAVVFFRQRRKCNDSHHSSGRDIASGHIAPFTVGHTHSPSAYQPTMAQPFTKRTSPHTTSYPSSSRSARSSDLALLNIGAAGVGYGHGSDSTGNIAQPLRKGESVQSSGLEQAVEPQIMLQRHQDSGVRLTHDSIMRVDVPPDYTAH